MEGYFVSEKNLTYPPCRRENRFETMKPNNPSLSERTWVQETMKPNRSSLSKRTWVLDPPCRREHRFETTKLNKPFL